MTKHASLAAFFDGHPEFKGGSVNVAHLSETELSAWAERSALAGSKPSSRGWLATAAFWTLIAALLIARFFFIDPAKLRPVESSQAQTITSAAR